MLFFYVLMVFLQAASLVRKSGIRMPIPPLQVPICSVSIVLLSEFRVLFERKGNEMKGKERTAVGLIFSQQSQRVELSTELN